jgi:poly-gamma-glutamate capsule biosynthesis protein CapA/YwtB (metallophosphatase superfamily)
MLDLCDMAQKAGAQIIVGCHPHVPSTTWHRQADAICWPSLGNFYFDQKRGAGVLLELRFFSQGTYAARIHALGNLYSASEK